VLDPCRALINTAIIVIHVDLDDLRVTIDDSSSVNTVRFVLS